MSSRHVDLLIQVAYLIVAALLLPWLKSLRDRAEAGRKRDALAVLEGLAETVVLEAEEEVRQLKDPTRADVGDWTPEMARRYQARALAFLKRIGAKELAVLASGVGAESLDDVARRIVEAQVEKARERRAFVVPDDRAPGSRTTPREIPPMPGQTSRLLESDR